MSFEGSFDGRIETRVTSLQAAFCSSGVRSWRLAIIPFLIDDIQSGDETAPIASLRRGDNTLSFVPICAHRWFVISGVDSSAMA
jgi:hypothetical protein